MTSEQRPDDATLAAILHRYALHAPARQLGIEVTIGVMLVSAALWLRPASGIVLVSVGTSLAMLGVWAWADRAVERARPFISRSWLALRGLAAVVGVIAALVTAFAGMSALLGTWIS